jgi:hypothetical protein
VAFAFNPHAFLDDLSRREEKKKTSDIREYKAHIVDDSEKKKK